MLWIYIVLITSIVWVFGWSLYIVAEVNIPPSTIEYCKRLNRVTVIEWSSQAVMSLLFLASGYSVLAVTSFPVVVWHCVRYMQFGPPFVPYDVHKMSFRSRIANLYTFKLVFYSLAFLTVCFNAGVYLMELILSQPIQLGVPRFFRWLSERYPMINQAAGNGIKPQFDCLYLDMNGIIHNCANKGASKGDISFEPAMYEKIYAYIDKLFSIVQPKQLLFLALDGVAPRAKMNQQRQRRFRTAAEAKEEREKALKRGDKIVEDPFDSNCITPGTEFMDRLSAHMEYFIRMKIRDDAAWRGIKVIFSGADAVGEGEHKILRYIRNMKMQPDYNPNLRHCLYGLDADLIMLSLLSHEPHIALLREEVVFGSPKNKLNRKVLVKPDEFQFLHISILREYLKLEFSEKDLKLPFEYDFERIVDDWILLGFLVGNDFLPNLPSMDIGEGGLDTLYHLYKDMLPTLGGYITHWGSLNRSRFEAVVRCLGLREDEAFSARAAQKERDLERGRYNGSGRSGSGQAEWAKPSKNNNDKKVNGSAPEPEVEGDFDFEATVRSTAEDNEATSGRRKGRGRSRSRSSSRGGRKSSSGSRERAGKLVIEDSSKSFNSNASSFVDIPSSDSEEEDSMDGEEENLYEDPHLNAQNYYRRKFPEFFPGTPQNALLPAEERSLTPEEHVSKLCAAYLEGICWCLKYYYAGIQSWRWYYPYRFVPLASSMRNLDSYQFSFDLGRPFTPLEQLLGVLPPQSAALLPGPYQKLMLDDRSPIIDFYPEEFDVDMNDKRNSWEGIALIPFIDEMRLMDAVASIDKATLTPGERERNRTTERYYLFTYDDLNRNAYVPPSHRVNPTCTPIQICKSNVELFTLPRIPIEPNWADEKLRASLKDLEKQDSQELYGGDMTRVGSLVYVGDPSASSDLTSEELKQHYFVEGRFLPILARGCKIPIEGFPSLSYILHDFRLWSMPTPESEHPTLPEETKEEIYEPPTLTAFMDPKAKINVFGGSSRKESVIVNVPMERVNRFAAASHIVKLVQKAQVDDRVGLPRVWCDYPYIREAQLVKISDSMCEYIYNAQGNAQYQAVNSSSQNEFKAASERIKNILASRCGIRAGSISAIVTVRLFEGMERLRDGSVRKRFSSETTKFPAQLIVLTEPFKDNRFVEYEPLPFEQRLKAGTRFMYVGCGYYGSEAEVIEVTKTSKTAQEEALRAKSPEEARKCVPTAKIRLTVLPPPKVALYKQLLASPLAQLEFFPSYMLARELGISGLVLGQICTSVTFNPGNVDLGLNIRFSRLGLQVSDYARRVRAWGGARGEEEYGVQDEKSDAKTSLDVSNNNIFSNAPEEGKRSSQSPESSPDQYRGNDGDQWHYSGLTAVILGEYIKNFPEVFEAVARGNSYKARNFGINIASYLQSGEPPEEYLDRAKRWLSSLAVATQIAVPCESLVVPARAALVLEELGEREHSEAMSAKTETIEVSDVTDREIYTYNPPVAWSPTESVQMALADRVISIRSDEGVPVNTRGTVVAVHGDICEVIFDVPFVSGTKLNGKCKKAKGKMISKKALLNLTQAQPQLPSSTLAQSVKADVPPRKKEVPEASTNDARADEAKEGKVRQKNAKPAPSKMDSNLESVERTTVERQASGGKAPRGKQREERPQQSANKKEGGSPVQSFPAAPKLSPNLASVLKPGVLSNSTSNGSRTPVVQATTAKSVVPPAPSAPSAPSAPTAPSAPSAPTAPTAPRAPTSPYVAPPVSNSPNTPQSTDIDGVRALLSRIQGAQSGSPATAVNASSDGSSPYAYVPAAVPTYGMPANPGFHFAAPGYPSPVPPHFVPPQMPMNPVMPQVPIPPYGFVPPNANGAPRGNPRSDPRRH